MGLMYSSAHINVHNDSQVNEEKAEAIKDDSDISDEDIFHETASIAPSLNDGQTVVVENLETTEDLSTETGRKRQGSIGESLDEEIARRSDVQENTLYPDMDIFTSPSIADVRTVPVTDANYCLEEEKGVLQIFTDEDNNYPEKFCTAEREETVFVAKIADLSSQRATQLQECSTFSLPLISEEKVSFHGKHAKSTSAPEMFRSAISSQQPTSEISASCAWQIDVDCFKSKRGKKIPQKYLRSKEDGPASDYSDSNMQTSSAARKNPGTKKWLVASEMTTQEMMAGRKVLDLRRW